jgi:DNA-directed RNA polymerase subunit RPC12/RpoP
MPSSPIRRIRLRVIPEPKQGSRSVFVTDNKSPDFVFINGQSPRTNRYDCGRCGKALMLNIDKNSVSNIVIKCPRCGSFNDIS